MWSTTSSFLFKNHLDWPTKWLKFSHESTIKNKQTNKQKTSSTEPREHLLTSKMGIRHDQNAKGTEGSPGFLWHSNPTLSPVHQVWPKPSCKAQQKGEEDKADRGRGGKTKAPNGQAWSSPSPRGQWIKGKYRGNWLRNHLWCPNNPRG